MEQTETLIVAQPASWHNRIFKRIWTLHVDQMRPHIYVHLSRCTYTNQLYRKKNDEQFRARDKVGVRVSGLGLRRFWVRTRSRSPS